MIGRIRAWWLDREVRRRGLHSPDSIRASRETTYPVLIGGKSPALLDTIARLESDDRCPNCGGSGYDPDEVFSENQLSPEEPCPVCHGMGELNVTPPTGCDHPAGGIEVDDHEVCPVCGEWLK